MTRKTDDPMLRAIIREMGGLSTVTLEKMAVSHWKKWRPKYYKELKEQHRLKTVSMSVAAKARKAIEEDSDDDQM